MINKIKNIVNNPELLNNNSNINNYTTNRNNTSNNETINIEEYSFEPNNMITQEKALDAIKQNFAINKENTNKFNQALYESVINDLKNQNR